MKRIFSPVLMFALVFWTHSAAAQDGTMETFTFTSDGTEIEGRIYLPPTYDQNDAPHSIYLIDFTEQHFRVALDEFNRLIDAAEQIPDLGAVVVTLKEHLNVDAGVSDVETYYDIFRSMTEYVDTHYTANTERTFVGRGSEGGLIMTSMLLESPETSVFSNFVATDSPASFNSHLVSLMSQQAFPGDKADKKLHFSFSTSNNRSSCLALIDAFTNADFGWLQFSSLEYTTSNYENTYPAAFIEGLNFVFDNVSTETGSNNESVPGTHRLGQNYPNPFNPTTSIRYALANSAYTSLKVFDVLGVEVVDLVDEDQSAGAYEVTLDASSLPSGVYYYRLLADGLAETRAMLLLK